MSDARIELTFQLWSAGADDRFAEYLDALTGLLPRHRGELVRRVEPVDPGETDPDAVLVMSFPNRIAVDSFLRDPARADMEDLAGKAVAQSLITDGRIRDQPQGNASVHVLHPEGSPDA